MALNAKHRSRRSARTARVPLLNRMWLNVCTALWLTSRMARFALGELRRTRHG